MTSILVVITFLAGASWGPVVTMTPTAGAEACAALRQEVAQQIAHAARTNAQGGASVLSEDGATVVVAGAIGARQMARLSCLDASR